MTKKEKQIMEDHFASILADIYSDIYIIRHKIEAQEYKEALREIKRLLKKFRK